MVTCVGGVTDCTLLVTAGSYKMDPFHNHRDPGKCTASLQNHIPQNSEQTLKGQMLSRGYKRYQNTRDAEKPRRHRR